MSSQRAKLSLVVPVYFEEDCIGQFVKETRSVLQTLEMDHEYIFVDDGSKDRTTEIIRALAAEDPCIKLVEFSYNHGKQAAVTAGIHYATGDYLLYMDPDLQDPPEEIPRFVTEITKGYDLVLGVRRAKMDTWVNRIFSRLFWWVLDEFTGLSIPHGLAVMRIFNRRFADQFALYGEQNRFIEGIFLHIGMNSSTLIIDQRKRFAGQSKFNFKRKMGLALDAILDFSELPLKMAVRLGALTSCLGFVAVIVVLVLKLTLIHFQAGWPSLLSLLILGFGTQLFFLGIAALYIGRIYRETKGRPLYSVKKTTNLDNRL